MTRIFIYDDTAEEIEKLSDKADMSMAEVIHELLEIAEEQFKEDNDID